MPNSALLSGERPSAPSTWPHTNWTIGQARAAGFFPAGTPTHDGVSYDFTWHHNIPWKTLRDTWNIAYVFCTWDVVEGLMNLYGARRQRGLAKRLRDMREALGMTEKTASGATYQKWLDRFQGGANTLLDSLSAEKQLTKVEADALEEGVAWQRWNIVEGPKESIRVEDPGSDDMDDFSRADRNRPMRYAAIDQLYRALLDLESDYNAARAGWADFKVPRDVWSVKLRGAVRNAQCLINQDLVMFTPQMWRVMYWGGNALTTNLSGKLYYQVRTRRIDEQ